MQPLTADGEHPLGTLDTDMLRAIDCRRTADPASRIPSTPRVWETGGASFDKGISEIATNVSPCGEHFAQSGDALGVAL